MKRRFYFLSVLISFSVFLMGCVTTPYQGDGKNKSEALLKQQFESAEKLRILKPEGRIIFAGFAMHSQSKAFRNDVITAEKSVLSIDPNALIFKLNNPAFGQDSDWPYATTDNMALVLKKISALARNEDKVIILFTTHGNVDVLSVNFANKYYPHVSPRVLNSWLSELRGKSTLLLLSACYSGSFIQPLSGPSRVVIAAADKDKASFGCQLLSNNTYFVDALFNQNAFKDLSIEQLMDQAKITIDKKERDQKLSPPSSPQISIGFAAKTWSNQPLKNWMRPQ